jgi:hypothetical protein
VKVENKRTNSRHCVQLRAHSFLGFPGADETNQQIIRKLGEEHLGDKEDIGGQGRLQHDGHVGGVEQPDGIAATHSTLTGRLDWDLDAEALEVDDGGEDGKCGQQIHDVWQVLSEERFTESELFVWPCEHQMHQCKDCALELRSTAGVDGCRREGFPDNLFANVGGDEQGDARAQAVSFLEQLIEKNDNEAGDDKLNDQEHADSHAEFGRWAVETREHVDAGLAKGHDDLNSC